MKRFSVCVLVMSLCSMVTGTVDAQYDSRTATTVSGGTLAARETWTAAQGSYHVVGSITIPAGGTLTIEPGVGVYLDAGVNVTVANGGRILAEGTEAREIQFARVPGAGSWGGLTLNGGSNSPETRLAYISFAGNGKTCIEVAGGTLYLDHATFKTTTHQYVSLDGASFVLSHCYFPSGTGSFELVHGTGGIKAGGRGIVRDSFFGHTNGYSDAMDFTGGNREQNQPIIQYYNNVFTGSSDDGLDLDGTDAWIEGNIFLHCHRNGAPDSSAAISGGNDGSRTSEVTIIGNLIFDCDNAATAKQGNFFTLINNTIVHTTKEGGLDFDSGVVCCRDTTPSVTTFGKGFYLEGNIIVDAEKLVRNYDAKHTTVTWNNNILPMPWPGPGRGNRVADPQLKHIPAASETYFTSWEEAQVLWDWFSLQAGSPGRGTGPNGADEGGVIPLGVSISGEPPATTSKADAILTVGVDRTGSGIPTGGFPLGSGFTSYRWRLDREAWSAETPLAQPILLTGLAQGPHHVEVVGKNDAGLYQDDAALGTDAVVTISPTWTVDRTGAHLQINEVLAKNVSAVANGDSYPGVIELHYDGLSDLDLSGMSVTNHPGHPNLFVFPAGTQMAPGQYLVLWADADTAAPGMHLGFTLSGNGGGLYLYDKTGTLVDSVEFGRQVADLSVGRVGYEDAWGLTVPTLGQMNLAVPLGDPNAVVINEWLAEGQVLFTEGFIELYNPGSDPVDLGGMYLVDDHTESPRPPNLIRPLSFVPGNGYAVSWADAADYPSFVQFRTSSGGTFWLFNCQGQEIDAVTYGPQMVDVSQGRAPDGGSEIEYLALPTPGAANPGGKIAITTTRTLVAEQADKRVLIPTGPVSDGWRGGSRTFDDSGWQLCTGGPGGVGYDTGSDYKPLISLDVQAQMHGSGKNNTCYIRVPFTLDANSLADVNELTLKMRSDDGFVAYLNGTEVARSNFAGTPAWNSHADSAIESMLGDFDEYADVSAFVSSLKSGANILAIHGMNGGTNSSDFLISTALDAVLWKVEDRSPPQNVLDLLDGLRITELMYHAPAGSQYDYIELTNVSQKALDMNGVRLDGNVSFVFPAVTLLPGECVVVAADVSAFHSTYGAGPTALGPYQGELGDAGGEVVLQLPVPFDAAVLRFVYSPTWYPSTDGTGESLVIRNLAGLPVTWNDPASWQPSDPTPGQP